MVDIIITAGVEFIIGCIAGICLMAVIIAGRED